MRKDVVKKYEMYAKLRDKAKMTDSEVSRQTEIPRACFGDWKAGRSAPGYDKLVRIARLFNVPADYFAED